MRQLLVFLIIMHFLKAEEYRFLSPIVLSQLKMNSIHCYSQSHRHRIAQTNETYHKCKTAEDTINMENSRNFIVKFEDNMMFLNIVWIVE